MSRWLRVLVCLVLVACLLVNISPIRARALVPEWILVGLGTVVASSLIGIGISAGTEAQAQVFTNVVNNACDWLQNSTEHVIFDDLTNAAKVLVYSTGDSKLPYMVQQSLVEDLRGWMFNSGVVEEVSSSAPTGFSSNIQAQLDKAATKPYSAYWYSNGEICIVWSEYSFVYYTEDGKNYIKPSNNSNDLYVWTPSLGGSWGFAVDITSVSGFTNFGTAVKVPTTSYDLTLGIIASEDVSFTEGYSDWSANASVAVDSSTGDDTPVVPIGLGQTQEETSGYSQAGVWAGTSTYVDTSTDTDTGTDTETGSGSTTGSATFSDVISEIKAIPQSIAGFFADVVAAVQAIPAAIADIFVPSAGLDYFSISLSDYFPFCIPFDIYDFLVCLNADPVAPVIEWEIYLPGGDTYPLEIDLSVFDSVAQLLRVLELLVFCIGLAAKTRDLIKG